MTSPTVTTAPGDSIVEVKDKPETPRSRSRRIIRWASKAMLRLTDRSDSTRNDRWYDKDDYKSFKTDCKNTIKKARSAGSAGPEESDADAEEDLCTRGLETGLDKNIKNLRNERRELALDAVYFEQEEQYMTGHHSPEEIAEAYRKAQLGSQIDAHNKALRYSEENKKEGLEGPLARFGKSAKYAISSVGGSMRNVLGKPKQKPGGIRQPTRPSLVASRWEA